VRSYGQFCAIARALDVVGDRWSLLIVRELLFRGACRYTDLLHGLPGIATNLLGERLRVLEQAGVIYREDAPPPIATTLYHLTARGQALRPVIVELARWGVPLMAAPADNDAFRTYWLAYPVTLYFGERPGDGSNISIEVRIDDESITIETVDGKLNIRPGAADDPELILSGHPQLIVGTLTGKLPLAAAEARGLTYEGDPVALGRLHSRADPEFAAANAATR
jgi:DNA-binding HxlR family transcriptional regulator